MGAIILRGTKRVHFTWPLFLLSALRKGHKLQPMQLAASQNCLLSNQNLIPQAQEWAENLSFSLIWAAFYLHLDYISLLWFCLRKQKWMQSQHVGNSRNESLNKTPILEMELVRGNTAPSGFQSINSMWSIDSKRLLSAVNQPQSSTAPTASHMGLSEPSPAPQAELEGPHVQWFHESQHAAAARG